MVTATTIRVGVEDAVVTETIRDEDAVMAMIIRAEDAVAVTAMTIRGVVTAAVTATATPTIRDTGTDRVQPNRRDGIGRPLVFVPALSLYRRSRRLGEPHGAGVLLVDS